MSIQACLSTGKNDWETPDDLFERLHQQYAFVLDAAASEINHKRPGWLGPGSPYGEDALAVDWEPWLNSGNIWLNPPYSREIQSKFVQKAFQETYPFCRRGKVVCLLPARTDTKMFHNYIWERDNVELTFLKGRLKFKGAKHAAPFPSMIAVFS